MSSSDLDATAALSSSAVPIENFDSMNELQRWCSILRLPVTASLQGHSPSRKYLERFTIGYSRQHRLLGFEPVSAENTRKLAVAICDGEGWKHLDTVARTMQMLVEPILVDRTLLETAINAAYSGRDSGAAEVLDTMDSSRLLSDAVASRNEDLLDTSGRAPIIRLVNQLLFDAVLAGASDIHIQPAEEHVLIRQRIDGILFDVLKIPKSIQEEVLTRVKVLGKMNIAEKRLPQDGRATVELGERIVDLRIASLPTSHNERIVIRLLDKSARLYTLGELGMPDVTLARWRELIRLDHGLILVTGPTGSGKSTTLYSALQEINSKELNVLTLEDPIEYQLEGISQSQINEKKGLTFAAGMRSVLRQDPDIIMVGEIRDRDTATMGIQASLTGHLVFSTLHTNDAASAVTRLLDLGVEPYLVASSLVASLAQRLIRRLCVQCRQPVEQVGIPGSTPVSSNLDAYRPVGCTACRHTGFSGRVGLFELLITNDELRELIQSRANASKIRDAALSSGLTLLSQDGLEKVRQGATTLAEVLRATSIDADAIE